MSDESESSAVPFDELEERTIADLQRGLTAGALTARGLASAFLARIEAVNVRGPCLRAVIETNPDALTIADSLDRERMSGAMRGPLHGIPILVKDSIATGDRMENTNGSLALLGVQQREATVSARLRRAGAIILGKANLSEWGNLRSTRSTGGWSGRGGLAVNPYALDVTTSGSSSGSASAVAANLVAASLGTETDASILSPASVNGVVGIKPTVGLTSRAGVIPVTLSQDTIGPMARTVADAAVVLTMIAGPDQNDAATERTRGGLDYTVFLADDGLRGARIGIARDIYWGYSEPADRVAGEAIALMRDMGAIIVDPANIPTAAELARGWPPADSSMLTVLLTEFKAGIEAWFAAVDAPFRSLSDLIAFNERNHDVEMPYFGQELFLMAARAGSLADATYRDALARNRRLAREEGIDAVMDRLELDALVMPTTNPGGRIDLVNGTRSLGSSARPAALAGYPAISVPAGHAFGLPVGITFMGRAFDEGGLIRLAYAFEQASHARRVPRFRRPSVLPGN